MKCVQSEFATIAALLFVGFLVINVQIVRGKDGEGEW